MKDATSPAIGWLVVGHGTRDAAGQDEFRQVVCILAEQARVPVTGGFLELAEPTIAHALAELAAQGVKRVLVVPLLLFSAGHAKDDVPAAVAVAARRLGIELAGQSAALELHPRMLELSRRRFQEAVGDEADLTETLLLMVGRGGSDPAALADMRRYTAVVAADLGIPGQTAFVALATPSVESALAEIATTRYRQVVVQPHLLFSGEVLQSLSRQVALAAEAHPHVKWLLASRLGLHPLLLEAIQGRIAEVVS